MPLFVESLHSRRRFLGQISAVAATFVARPLWAGDSAAVARLALFSDTHVPENVTESYRGFWPAENCQRAVGMMMEYGPEAAVLSGDAARLEGKIGDYQRLQKLLRPLIAQCPVAIGMGNHDDRVNFRKVFTEPEPGAVRVTDRLVMVLEWPVVRVVVLDSLISPNHAPGRLGKAQRQWLQGFLAQHDLRPTVLVMHHPPRNNEGDLLDSDQLLQLIQPYPQVKALIFGHSHVWDCQVVNGLQWINLPAVGYNFNDQQPVGWVGARFIPDGVDLTLHSVGGSEREDGWTTSLAWQR
jgi:3',5'-cyclic AMP phosphodiesterase CpdA